jgi:hypothetical protein
MTPSDTIILQAIVDHLTQASQLLTAVMPGTMEKVESAVHKEQLVLTDIGRIGDIVREQVIFGS